MARLDERTADCRVLTFKEGLLSAAAHDLELRVGRFTIEVDPAAPSVSARFDPASLRVEHALHDGRPAPAALSAADKRKIERTIADEVLEPRRFPEIRFASTAIEGAGDTRRVRGTLSLHGVERAIAIDARREGGRWLVEARLHQPDFAIRPYTAMLGTLRIKADVLVRLALPDVY